MRVLTVGNRFPPAAHGGYERLWLSALAALREAGHAPSVLTTEPVAGAQVPPGADTGQPWPVSRELRWWWRDFGWPRFPPGRVVHVERRNRRVLERHLADADALLTFNLGGMGLSLLAHARRAGVPAVGVLGDLWPVYGPQHDPWTRRRLRLPGLPATGNLAEAADWIAISEWVVAQTGFPARIAHPGVDLPAAAPAPAGPPRRLLVAGRLEPEKGPDVAVRALAHLPATHRLVLDGPGDPHHLQHLAADAGVADRLTVTRSAPEAMGEAYAAADAVLFCVRWPEPWGLVPLEAMAAGRPVVATATGGAAEYLRDGENALVVGVDDPEAVAAAVERLEDAELRERLVAGGRATAARFPRAAFDAELVAAVERAGAAG